MIDEQVLLQFLKSQDQVNRLLNRRVARLEHYILGLPRVWDEEDFPNPEPATPEQVKRARESLRTAK